MKKRTGALRVLEYAVFIAIIYAGLQLAIYLGVEEKSWLERSWEFITGGTLGILAGICFFVVFGSIGWVCGSLYGAIGLLGLATMGALGGFGLGAIVNIIRDPQKFNYTWSVIIPVLIGSFIFSKYISGRISRQTESKLMLRNPIDDQTNIPEISHADG